MIKGAPTNKMKKSEEDLATKQSDTQSESGRDFARRKGLPKSERVRRELRRRSDNGSH